MLRREGVSQSLVCSSSIYEWAQISVRLEEGRGGQLARLMHNDEAILLVSSARRGVAVADPTSALVGNDSAFNQVSMSTRSCKPSTKPKPRTTNLTMSEQTRSALQKVQRLRSRCAGLV